MKRLSFFSIATLLVLLALPSLSQASSVYSTCSNVDGSIQIERFGTLKILINRYAPDGSKKETWETFQMGPEGQPHPGDDVVKTVIEHIEVEDRKRGTARENIWVDKVSFRKKDGSSMPNAYGRLANEDGTLSDVLLCNLTIIPMPERPVRPVF